MLFERILDVMSSRSFPRPGHGSTLTEGERNQMRNAMIFCTRVREGRDIFVTDDVTFGSEGSAQRQQLSALAPQTKIMTLPEFERYCDTQQA